MATIVEQITNTGDLVFDFDEAMSIDERWSAFDSAIDLPITRKKYGRTDYYLVEVDARKPIAILAKQITYLGNPHPSFKKRIQIPKTFQSFYQEHSVEYDIRFMGVYAYKGNIIFTDFEAAPYALRKSHNSSAHVYTNDLYQAVVEGEFSKVDAFNNLITVIRSDKLSEYLVNGIKKNPVFEFFDNFNEHYAFNTEIDAKYAITTMKEEGSSNWAQGEWPGFFTEHEFSKYAQDHGQNIISFQKNKAKDELDLDLFVLIPSPGYLGDLKTSNNEESTILCNDQETMLEALNKYGKLWYVIYGVDVVKDSGDYETTKWYNYYKLNAGKGKTGEKFNPLSYKSRMKSAVTYTHMFILEINKANKDALLQNFSQGHQPDGAKRKPKFKITKKSSAAENAIIYRWSPADHIK